jgi:hypothetical protein
VGTALSVLILLGVFGVLIVGVIMNPDRPAAEAVEESPAVIPTAAER